MAAAADNALPNDRENDEQTQLFERLRELVERLGSKRNAADFLERVLEQLAGGRGRPALSLEDAFLAVLARRNCPPKLLATVDRLLHTPTSGWTVKAAAQRARVSRKTLNRQGGEICTDRGLHEFFCLIKLVHIVVANGSVSERAAAARISARTARRASRDLMQKPLAQLVSEPAALIRVLEVWLRLDVPTLH